MARIILATLGSLGDLHPIIALALELRRRGHEAVVATSECYREKIHGLDLDFHPLRPDLLTSDATLIAEVMDGPRGSERLFRKHLFPVVRAMYADLVTAVAGADLLIASELVFAAPIVAAKHAIPWVSYQLAPIVDHIDAHRSILMMAGPYVKKNYVSQTHANFGSILKVIYNVLAVPYVNHYDITASLLSDFFTTKPDYTPYSFEFPSQEVFDWDKAMKKYNQPIDWRKIKQGPKMDNEAEQRSEHNKTSGTIINN